MDKEKSAEDDKRRRERRKEREARREKDGKSKDGKSAGGSRRKPQGLDLIDQLDVTGIYGQGRESNSIHHPLAFPRAPCLTERLQCSTMTVPLMRATPTVTVRRTTARRCKLSLPAQPTILSAALDQ